MANLMKFSADVRNAFDNDQCKFDNFNKLMLDVAHNSLEEGITLKNANDKITAIFKQICGVDEHSTRAEVRKAVRKHQAELFEITEILVPNLLQTGLTENEFYNQYVETRNVDLNESTIFYTEDETILSVSKVSGNHWDIDRVKLGKGKSFSVETSWYGISVYEEYERIMAGVSDFSKFVTKLYEAVDRFLNESIYLAMQSAAEQLPGGASGSGQWVKTGSLDAASKDKFLTLIEDVEMATGKSVVIMGTKTALNKLNGMQDVDWISSNMKEERYSTGALGYFEGTPLVEIRQGFKLNDTTQRLFDDKMLFIMPVDNSNKFIKVVNEGQPEMRQVQVNTENQDMTYQYTYMFKIGVGVMINLLFGVWYIT